MQFKRSLIQRSSGRILQYTLGYTVCTFRYPRSYANALWDTVLGLQHGYQNEIFKVVRLARTLSWSLCVPILTVRHSLTPAAIRGSPWAVAWEREGEHGWAPHLLEGRCVRSCTSRRETGHVRGATLR